MINDCENPLTSISVIDFMSFLSGKSSFSITQTGARDKDLQFAQIFKARCLLKCHV